MLIESKTVYKHFFFEKSKYELGRTESLQAVIGCQRRHRRKGGSKNISCREIGCMYRKVLSFDIASECDNITSKFVNAMPRVVLFTTLTRQQYRISSDMPQQNFSPIHFRAYHMESDKMGAAVK